MAIGKETRNRSGLSGLLWRAGAYVIVEEGRTKTERLRAERRMRAAARSPWMSVLVRTALGRQAKEERK
jgi:hypothetical protein